MFNPLLPWQNSKIHNILDNAEKLRMPPQVKKIKSFKRLNKKDVPTGYSLFKGIAEATKFEGTPKSVSKVRVKLPVYKLSADCDEWAIIWERADCEVGGILTVEWDQDQQGRFFKLQEHMDKAAEYLFGTLGFKSFIAKAGIPREDIGVRTKFDWRDRMTDWREHRETGEEIRLSRLMIMWLHCKWIVPEQFLDSDAGVDRLVWLNPYLLAELPDSELAEMDEALGDARRWRFSDAKCLQSG